MLACTSIFSTFLVRVQTKVRSRAKLTRSVHVPKYVHVPIEAVKRLLRACTYGCTG